MRSRWPHCGNRYSTIYCNGEKRMGETVLYSTAIFVCGHGCFCIPDARTIPWSINTWQIIEAIDISSHVAAKAFPFIRPFRLLLFYDALAVGPRMADASATRLRAHAQLQRMYKHINSASTSLAHRSPPCVPSSLHRDYNCGACNVITSTVCDILMWKNMLNERNNYSNTCRLQTMQFASHQLRFFSRVCL